MCGRAFITVQDGYYRLCVKTEFASSPIWVSCEQPPTNNTNFHEGFFRVRSRNSWIKQFTIQKENGRRERAAVFAKEEDIVSESVQVPERAL